MYYHAGYRLYPPLYTVQIMSRNNPPHARGEIGADRIARLFTRPITVGDRFAAVIVAARVAVSPSRG